MSSPSTSIGLDDPSRRGGKSGVPAAPTSVLSVAEAALLLPRVERLTSAWLRVRTVPLALAGLLFALVYGGTFNFMAGRWSSDSAYQHGWLVIPVAVGVIWYRRARLAQVPVGSNPAGLALMALALLMHLFEKAVDLNGPSPVSIPIFLAGAVWYFLGGAFLRELAFPIAYLLFMVPIPGGFTEVVSFPLRMLATNGSKLAAGWFGVDVQGAGMNINFGQPYGREWIALTVADPCSGLHSLMAIKALHAITAYLTRLRLVWKWVLFMCALPIALAANLTRVTGIILVGAYWSKDVALGLFHDWAPLMLFVIAFAILISIGRLLEWLTLPNPSRDRLLRLVTGRKPASASEEAPAKPAAAVPVYATPRRRSPGAVGYAPVIAMLAVTLLGGIAFARQPEPESPIADVTKIPAVAGGWVSQGDQRLDANVMAQIKSDSHLDRWYYNPTTGQYVELLVVYRRYGRREFAHRPELCFPAAGYTVEKNGTVPLYWGGRDVPANQITANAKDGKQSNLSYFFASGKRTESSFVRQQVVMAFERLSPNKNGWTFIRLQSPTVTTPQDALAAQQDFMRMIAPEIERVITTDHRPIVASASAPRF